MSETSHTVSVGPHRVGLLALLVALAASALLVSEHFGALSLPGCGPESACARAAASAFGKLPGTGWPVSFIGASWFAALLVARLRAGGPVSSTLRWGVRLSAVASLGFLIVMGTGGYLCPYCLAVHGANLAFWGTLERAPRAAATAGEVLAPLAVGVLASVGLGLVDRTATARVEEQQEDELAESTAEIIAASEGPGEHGDSPVTTGVATGGGRDDTLPADEPFVGRYPQGPEEAVVRVVVFSDYQCPDCLRVERQLREIAASGASVSISMKHFPMCADCNPHTFGQSPHPNACLAARAVEAAGLLGGAEAFDAVHTWLFDREGLFTEDELATRVSELGLDAGRYRAALHGDEALARVRADIEEAREYGIHFTPMVFLNGVELRGVFAPNAVRRAIEAVLEAAPEPASHAYDRPAPALEKLVGDWREGKPHAFAEDTHPHWFGPPDATVEIVVWADHRDRLTAELDRKLRTWIEANGGARYNFRHFPFERGCNQFVKRDGHVRACRAARATEAAFLLGGEEAFRRMHSWLLDRPEDALDDAMLGGFAAELGMEAGLLFQTMRSPAEPAIIEDVRAGSPMLYRGRIPTIYVDGRVVPRWQSDDGDVLGAILSEATARR